MGQEGRAAPRPCEGGQDLPEDGLACGSGARLLERLSSHPLALVSLQGFLGEGKCRRGAQWPAESEPQGKGSRPCEGVAWQPRTRGDPAVSLTAALSGRGQACWTHEGRNVPSAGCSGLASLTAVARGLPCWLSTPAQGPTTNSVPSRPLCPAGFQRQPICAPPRTGGSPASRSPPAPSTGMGLCRPGPRLTEHPAWGHTRGPQCQLPGWPGDRHSGHGSLKCPNILLLPGPRTPHSTFWVEVERPVWLPLLSLPATPPPLSPTTLISILQFRHVKNII